MTTYRIFTPCKKLFMAGFVILVMWVSEILYAHEVKIPVIVDTDVALDDLRALTLLLQDDHFQIMAIVTSDGACAPRTGAVNILRALKFMGFTDIPVGVGRILNEPAPPWRAMSETMGWGDFPAIDSTVIFKDAQAVLREVLSLRDDPVVYICLGSLTSLAELMRSDPVIKKKISSLAFYGNPLSSPELSWNTARDTLAVREVFTSGITVRCYSQPDSLLLLFDTDLYDALSRCSGTGAEFVKKLHEHADVQKLLKSGHFIVWDETPVLCLMEPEIVDYNPVKGHSSVFILTSLDLNSAREVYMRNCTDGEFSNMKVRRAVIFEKIPTEPELLRGDIRPLAADLIHRYGLEEWYAVLLTNELHRHLGIYSILGAKMGIRAREILGASLDELEVVSYASLQPPLSCLNDGLQAATGASLGRGTIRVENSEPSPRVLFIKGTDKLILKIKDSILVQIRKDIAQAIAEYGNLTPEYFSEIRRLSLRYWLDSDRRYIFDETLTRDKVVD